MKETLRKTLCVALMTFGAMGVASCKASTGVTSLGDGKIAVSRNKVVVIPTGFGVFTFKSNIAPKVIDCNVETSSRHC